MTIYEDTGNKTMKHENIHNYCKLVGVTIRRWKLDYGDYTLPLDRTVSIDTKSGLQEVYMDVIQDHARFKAELIGAQALKMRLIMLVEESGIESLADVVNWENPRMARWKKIDAAHKDGKMLGIKISNTPPAASPKLAMIMQRLSERYNVEWQFCDKSDTGRRIIELLTSDGKI